MATVDDKSLDQFSSAGDDQPISPEHRAWMNAQIRNTLAKKQRGEMGYTALDKVRRALGIDAP